MAKPSLRNPGPWTFAIFAAACVLVGTLYVLKAPEAAKLAAELVGLVVATFGAKSALGVKLPKDRNASKAIAEVAKLAAPTATDASAAIAEVAKLARPPMPTWPEIPVISNTPVPDDVPDTKRDGAT